jgi:cytochrome c oxidase subunit 2
MASPAVPPPRRPVVAWPSGRQSAAAVLALAVLLLGGCAWDTPQTSLVPRSDLTRAIHGVYAIITWAAVIIAFLVLGLLAWILGRFRERPAAPLPRQTRGHGLLEIAWTIAPALVLLAIAVPTIQVIFRTQAPASPGALQIDVVGKQWWWEYRYPTLGVVTANELHVPAGRPVAIRLVGWDVIHSFWVPQIAAKRDVIPGRLNTITFTADTPGTYWGQCAEYCGTSHANMMLRLIVDPPEVFERWVQGELAPAAEPAGPAAEGKAIYTASACVGCHTIKGVSTGLLGPDLTHFGRRTTLAAGMFPSGHPVLTAWLKDPQALKPGAKMPNLGLTDTQASALATYLLSLK